MLGSKQSSMTAVPKGCFKPGLLLLILSFVNRRWLLAATVVVFAA